MGFMTIAARSDRPDGSSATAAKPAVSGEPRPHGAPRTSLVQHWPLLFILAGAVAMVGWIGAIAWAAISLLLWIAS